MSSFSGLFGGASGSGQYAVPHIGYKSGRYYWPVATAAAPTTAATSPVANTIYFCPFYLFSDVSIATLVMANTGSAENGRKVRLGVYANANGEPGALEVAANEITLTNAAAVTEAAAVVSLTKGWHFFAYLMDTSSSAITGITTPGNVLPSINFGQRGVLTSAANALTDIYLQASFSYAALPSTAPALASTATNLMPLVRLKIA